MSSKSTTKRRRLSGGWSLKSTTSNASDEAVEAGATNVENFVNNDEEEKRVRRKSLAKVKRRRKSMKLNPFDLEMDENDTDKKSGKITPRATTKLANDNIVGMYKAVIKMSAENKINVKNTWSLPLIENIQQAILDEEKPGQPNFTKASCALDASVKIYGYRVDDTLTSSFRVLENISRREEVEEDGNMDSSGEGKSKKKKTRSKVYASTLETNPQNINVKKYDLAFDVDPLFHEMSKKFDEGGARGMLLNNLCVHNGCSIIFDSQDKRLVNDGSGTSSSDDVIEQGEEEGASNNKPAAENSLTTASKVDPMLGRKVDKSTVLSLFQGSTNTEIQSLDLCPSFRDLQDTLKSLKRQLNNSSSIGSIKEKLNEYTTAGISDTVTTTTEELATSMYGEGLDGDDGSDDDEYGAGFYNNDEPDPMSMNVVDAGQAISFSATNNDAVESHLDELEAVILDNNTNSDYAFFDTSKLSDKMWTGPSYWKTLSKKPVRTSSRANQGLRNIGDDDENMCDTKIGGGGGKRTRKEKFSLNFKPTEEELKDIDAKMKLSARLSSNTLSDKITLSEEEIFQPEDSSFQTNELASLFLRPTTTLRSNKRSMNEYTSMGDSQDFAFDGSMDTDMIAAVPYTDNICDGIDDEDDSDDDNNNDMGHLNDENHEMIPPSFSSLDANFSKLSINDDSDLLDVSRKIEKINIKYAQRATRVDVRKLKTTLWDYVEERAVNVIDLTNENDIISTTTSSDPPAVKTRVKEEEGLVENQGVTVPSGGSIGKATINEKLGSMLSFKETVKSMAESASDGNVSVPFYFICMLHLANEKGLDFFGQENLADFKIQKIKEEA